MDEAISTDEKWEKKQKEKKKRIDKLKKMLPNNKVIGELNGTKIEEKRNSGKWDLIDDIVWAARDAYLEEGLSFDEAVTQLKAALDGAVKICKKKSDPEYEELEELAKN